MSTSWLQVSLLAELPGIAHAFTTRLGPEGTALDLKYPEALNSADLTIQANRQWGLKALQLPLDSLVAGQQVHGCHIATISREDQGRGARDARTAFPATDGLVTATPGVALMVMVADCVPILAADPVKKVVGAVHAGWRGTQQHILSRLLQQMQTQFDCQPSHIRVAIGPSIGPCCFEVDTEVVNAFADDFIPEDSRFVSYPGPKPHLDLWMINREQALQAGLLPEHITSLKRCTVCESDTFFSFRKELGQTGRFAGLIALTP